MKIKAINRSETEHTRDRSQDLIKVHRNLDPILHPFEKAKEYSRALNAAKLERVFAKPFICAFPHADGVTSLARNPQRLNSITSGCANGDVALWDVPAKRCLRKFVGHTAAVKGVSYTPRNDAFVTCSTDATVKLWKAPYAPFESGQVVREEKPIFEFQGKSAFQGIDHHWNRNIFATAGAQVDIWDHTMSEPTESFTWGADSVISVRFNPAEPDVFVTTGTDRSIALYDLRMQTPIRKLILQTRTNSVAWNPIEAFNFTVANEDCNLYTFDMRSLRRAACVHQDFVSAVMDVDYSPTGREFVAGAYDRSVRIFAFNGGHSKDVYHTKRMQRVFSVRFSGDGTYVMSGSDDMNVRVWKANASEQLGVMLPREKHKAVYHKALVDRYKHLPEVKRILRHRHLPAAIYKASKLRRTMMDAETGRLKRRIAHSKPGSVRIPHERTKKIIDELE